ncbi:MAG: tetratricopeptide repeat protein, partial [Actinomycetota bacterium]
RKAGEVRRRTGGRVTTGEMSTRPTRERIEWSDEGGPGARQADASRAKTRPKAAKGGRRELRALDDVIEEFEKRLGKRSSGRAIKRYEAALVPFEAHRYDEARKMLLPMAKEYQDVSAVHEILGLCLYRAGNWAAAARELERALELNPRWLFNHAVLADCHRALGNHARIAELWDELAAASPNAEIVAEGRIVVAGSFADQGDLDAAIAMMKTAVGDQSRPGEHHLRQWYVLGDLHDRAGNVILARQFFERVARHEPDFADVAERLSVLGT